jgi:hypothetical protein
MRSGDRGPAPSPQSANLVPRLGEKCPPCLHRAFSISERDAIRFSTLILIGTASGTCSGLASRQASSKALHLPNRLPTTEPHRDPAAAQTAGGHTASGELARAVFWSRKRLVLFEHAREVHVRDVFCRLAGSIQLLVTSRPKPGTWASISGLSRFSVLQTAFIVDHFAARNEIYTETRR